MQVHPIFCGLIIDTQERSVALYSHPLQPVNKKALRLDKGDIVVLGRGDEKTPLDSPLLRHALVQPGGLEDRVAALRGTPQDMTAESRYMQTVTALVGDVLKALDTHLPQAIRERLVPAGRRFQDTAPLTALSASRFNASGAILEMEDFVPSTLHLPQPPGPVQSA